MKDYLKTLRTLRGTPRARLGVIAVVAGLVLSGCFGGSPKPTDVKISAPAPGTTINVGQGTVIQGEANGDNITRVEVVVDGKAYASLSTPDKTKGVPNFPVSVPWTPMSAGTHAIQLRAFGLDDKLMGQSEPLVMDAKPSLAQVTPTGAATRIATAAAVATATAGGLPTAAVTAAPAATSAAEGPSLTVTNDFVNVREGPNIGYQLLGRLNKDESAPVRGKSQDGKWWQISYAAGTNGVGWVFGDYVQANGAANNVPVASAPPLPTEPPAPPPPVLPTLPPPTAIVVQPTPVPSLPTVGSLGQLKVDVNPVASGGAVNAYWNVSNIQGIWFDKGDGSSFQPAAGSQTVNVPNITGQRMLQLKWRDSSGTDHIDQLTIYLSGQVVATTVVSQNCNSSDPNWRGSDPTYPFCVAKDMDWVDQGSPVRNFANGQDFVLGVSWNIYGISGIYVVIEPSGQWCGPAGPSSRSVATSGNLNGSNASYSWNVKDFGYGGYHVTLEVHRNDGGVVRFNDKFFCVGTSSVTAPTSTPAPATATPKPPTPTTIVLPTHTPKPTAAP